MANQKNNSTDDFFDFLSEDSSGPAQKLQVKENSPEDEIIFKDKDGKIKVLRNGSVEVLEEPENIPAESARAPMPMGKSLDVDNQVQEIVKKSLVNFSDDSSKRRFESIVRTRLKGVRGHVQTREILLSKLTDGGMGFDVQVVEKIMKVINEVNQKLNEGLRALVSQEKVVDEIEDIRFQSQLVGPIEELERVTLIDFRRLGAAKEAASNILGKISILEQDSFTDKLEGIKAWHSSQVNQLYVSIGQESIEKSLAVSEVIAQRDASNQETLTNEEFEAISDLNQKLRYYR